VGDAGIHEEAGARQSELQSLTRRLTWQKLRRRRRLCARVAAGSRCRSASAVAAAHMQVDNMHESRTALTNVVSWEDKDSTWVNENLGSKNLSHSMWL